MSSAIWWVCQISGRPRKSFARVEEGNGGIVCRWGYNFSRSICPQKKRNFNFRIFYGDPWSGWVICPHFTDLHSSWKERQLQKSCVSFGEECCSGFPQPCTEPWFPSVENYAQPILQYVLKQWKIVTLELIFLYFQLKKILKRSEPSYAPRKKR